MSETMGAVQRAKEPAAVQPAAAKAEHPLDRMNRVFEDVARRAFEIFENNGRIMGHDLEDWFKAERELLHPVNIELTESDAAFAIRAEVPGFNEKELEISVEPRRVVIAGKHEFGTEERKGKMVRSETSAEQMLRVIDLPGVVETAKATATLQKNGILALTLPKVAPTQTVRIKPATS
jgi:HSP20 family protein